MKIKEAIEIVKKFNSWRRGAEIPQPNPKEIGIALETLIEYAESKKVKKK